MRCNIHDKYRYWPMVKTMDIINYYFSIACAYQDNEYFSNKKINIHNF